MMKKPSVTALLDLLAKPALIGWANKQGLMGIEIKAKRKVSLEAGTSIHSQIESGCFDRQIDATAFCSFMHGKKILATEQDIETEWFIGRYDVSLLVNEQEYIVDYKRSSKGRIYLENKLQLVAYTMAKPALMAIVHVPTFQFIPVQIVDRKPYEQMLIHLAAVWQLKEEINRV